MKHKIYNGHIFSHYGQYIAMFIVVCLVAFAFAEYWADTAGTAGKSSLVIDWFGFD